MEKEYIQIGITAMRDPTNFENFLPAVPLYIEKTDTAEKSAESLIDDIIPLMQERFKQYARESGLLERKIAARAKVLEAATMEEAEAAENIIDGSGRDQGGQ